LASRNARTFASASFLPRADGAPGHRQDVVELDDVERAEERVALLLSTGSTGRSRPASGTGRDKPVRVAGAVTGRHGRAEAQTDLAAASLGKHLHEVADRVAVQLGRNLLDARVLVAVQRDLTDGRVSQRDASVFGRDRATASSVRSDLREDHRVAGRRVPDTGDLQGRVERPRVHVVHVGEVRRDGRAALGLQRALLGGVVAVGEVGLHVATLALEHLHQHLAVGGGWSGGSRWRPGPALNAWCSSHAS